MANQKFTLTFDANLNVNQMKGALNLVQSELNKLSLPQNFTRNFDSIFNKLSEELRNFSILAGKDITSKTDFSKLEKSAEKITTLFENLKLQIKDIGKLSNDDLEKLLPSNIIKNIQSATKALENYKASIVRIQSEVTKAEKNVRKFQSALSVEQNKTPVSEVKYKELGKILKEAEAEVDNYTIKLQELKTKQSELTTKLIAPKKSSTYRSYTEEIKQTEQALEAAKQKVQALGQELANTTTNKKHAQALQELNIKYTEAMNTLTEWKKQLEGLKNISISDGGLKQLFDFIGSQTGLDMSKFKTDAQGAGEAIQTYLNQALQEFLNKINLADAETEKATGVFQNFGDVVRRDSENIRAFDQRLSDVSALKSRIQYFFGLNNTINLFRRAIRNAFNTIKELDKAMTETAVVTNFSVGDMWEKLPEYTKRANELGVTTKDAYEAATLYYQQGLSTKEVTELSVETLKMARIAGLEAADATDRMTNALRGFNMELNAINAQRVDDVYSRLAAISASNVDEISTAMTKVASLAHNAGMEFETTAAFLAQIIETTRESAETAGTALKTVVARFAEVKKLVNEDQLRGNDEEGELIDVNRVSEALRSAGIDLNKYFLGEVGIDDIFMELAKKWDSLTSLQQRYIATQAAGSRQQSRFIALMSDYARTQELVSEAYNANGAAAKQFEKTQESLESKLARLKNAWNEFLMGLTNSTVVKLAVDGLTTLLNLVNNLTGAFGDGVGSILKWTVALASLRGLGRLVAAGGGLEKLIGLLTAGKGLAGGFGSIASINASSAVAGGGLIQTLLGGTQKLGRTVISNTGIIGDIGSKAFGGLTGLGLSTGVATSLMGIVTALGAVGAAVGAIVLAYKAWLKLTPEGQLKAAKKLADQLEKDADNARKASDAIKNLQTNYEEQTKTVEQANTVDERRAAIQARNEAILKAIEEKPEYAGYLQQSIDSLTGELVLELNSEAVENAAVEAAKKATEAAIDSYIANADVGLKEAQSLFKQQQGTKVRVQGEEQYMPGKEPDQSVETEAKRQAQLNYAQSQLSLAYSSVLRDYDKALANAIAEVLSNIAVESQEIIEKAEVGAVGEAVKNGSLSKAIFELATSQNLEFSIVGTNLETGFDEFLTTVGITSDEINNFGNFIGKDTELIRKLLKARAQEIQQIQQSNQTRLQERITAAGRNTNITSFSPSQIATIEDTAAAAEEILTNAGYKQVLDELLKAGISNDTEQLERIQTLINSINVDDPIASFAMLNKIVKDSKNEVNGLAREILRTNPELSNAGKLVQSLQMSEEYNDILESIQKTLETNEKLGAADIESLAKESKSLNTLLKEGVVTTRTLAKLLTAIAQGKLSFNQINDSLIDVLDNMYTFEDLIDDVHNYLANFDEGIDYGEGVDFLKNKADELVELINNWEFGNQRTRNLYEMFFGTNYMDDWAKGDQYIRDQVAKMARWIENDAYGFFSDSGIMAGLGITQTGPNQLHWDITGQYNDIEDMVSKVAEVAGISQDAAKMLIEAFASHGDIEYIKELEQLSQNSAIKAITSKIESGEKTVWTEDELTAIANELGIKYEKLIELIQEKIDGKNIDFNPVKTLTGENLFTSFEEKLNSDGMQLDEFMDQFIEKTENGARLKLEQLQNALTQMGYSEAEQRDLINSITSQDKYKDLATGDVALNNLSFTLSSVAGTTVTPEAAAEFVEQINTEFNNSEEPFDVIVNKQISATFGDSASLDDDSKAAMVQWIADQLFGETINIAGLIANPTFDKLSGGAKTAILTAIANFVKGGQVNFKELQANLIDIGLTEAQITSVLQSLGFKFFGKNINLNGLSAQLSYLQLDKDTKDQILNWIENQVDTTGTVNLGELDAFLGGLNLSTAQKRRILRLVANDLKDSGPININNIDAELSKLNLTDEEIDNVLTNLEKFIAENGDINLTNLDTFIASLKISEENKDGLRRIIASNIKAGTIDLNGLKADLDKLDLTKEQKDNILTNLENLIAENGELTLEQLDAFIASLKLSEENKEGLRRIIASNIKSGEVEIGSIDATLTKLNLSDDDKAKIKKAIEDDIKAGDIDLNGLKAVLTELGIDPKDQEKIIQQVQAELTPNTPIEIPVTIKTKVKSIETGAMGEIDRAVQRQHLINQLENGDAYLGGNVNLFDRPKVPAYVMQDVGWDVPDNTFATLMSNTFTDETGTVAINFTPIFTKPDGTVDVLEPDSLAEYAEEVIAGTREDDLGLQIGPKFTGESAILAAEEFAQWLHEWHEEYFAEQEPVDINAELVVDPESVKDNLPDEVEQPVAPQVDEEALTESANNAGEALEDAYNGAVDDLSDKIVLEVTDASGNVTTIVADTEEELATKFKDYLNNATDDAVASLKVKLPAGIDYNSIYQALNNPLVLAGYNAAEYLHDALIKVISNGGIGWTIPIRFGGGAAGGIVTSRAAGGNQLKPGPALTGEEGAEIIWNKEKGYAYITGKNGPEFQNLNAGDRVFNAQQTKRILRNSSVANGGIVSAYGTGRWGAGDNSGGGSRDSDSDKTPTVWKNELDWLYNLMQDIDMLEREQTKLGEQHDRYLSDITKTGRDLYNLTKKQLDNLYTQRSNYIEALARRQQEMAEQIGTSGYGNYVWWNSQDQTVEIDWDAIEAIQDKDVYDEVSDLISRVEKIQDEMQDAQDALWDIEGQIKELEERYLDEFTDFQQRVLDAIINQYQLQIDRLSELDSTLSDTNQKILSSLQKEIDYSRQIRDNTKTEDDIINMEARLAFLQRDTTSANLSEIKQLEKQLDEARENYSDTLIDQAINRLSETNEKAAEQRQQQINLLTEQLEYWKTTGQLWDEVGSLMEQGISSDGSLITGSELEHILQDTEGWKAMSEQQKEVWGDELITSVNQAGAYLLKMAEGLDGISAGVWALIPKSSVVSEKLQYASGGLNTRTGWAWLDGTANEPEYVLNARETDAFLKLSEILPTFLEKGDTITSTTSGDIYLELTMNIAGISNDYDVDRLVDRVKKNIYDVASYRNVNAVNFQR